MAENTQNKPKMLTLHIDEVTPYWRNPRRIPAEAVNAVRASMEEYGYAQPIVVDEDHVIVIGHTRYTAMRRMGVENVQVAVVDYLSPAQVKELRVVDNRANEFTTWDFDRLSEELEHVDPSSMVLEGMFQEYADQIVRAEESPEEHEDEDRPYAGPSAEEFEKDESWSRVQPNVEFVCPKCFHEWVAEVTRERLMSGRLKAQKG